MNWFLLGIASAFEVEWAVAMKFSEGFTRPIPAVLTVVGYILSAVFLSMALKNMSLGTAYAIWTGIGIVGTTVLGVLLFKETLSLPQVLCVLLIVAGIVGLRILSQE